MNIFSSASARMYPSILLMSTLLCTACEDPMLTPPGEEPLTQAICFEYFLEFSERVPWAAYAAEFIYVSRADALDQIDGTAVFLPLFGVSVGGQAESDGGYVCAANIADQEFTICQQNYLTSLTEERSLRSLEELDEDFVQCNLAQRCQDIAAEERDAYLEAGATWAEARQAADHNLYICMCNAFGHQSPYCLEID